MADGHEELARFAQALRGAGVPVHTSRVIEFCRAVALLPGDSVEDLFWAGRLTLVSRPQDLAVYDRIFVEHFSGLSALRRRVEVPPAAAEPPRGADLDDASDELEPEGIASPAEVLRRKDFAAMSEGELEQLATLLATLDIRLPPRRSRRWRTARRGRPDMRRTVRDALRNGGEPRNRYARVRRTRPRRLVLVLDVSHSMADYSRALLMFAHASLRARRSVEVFCFGTRLTRMTATLSRTRPEQVLEYSAERVLDWDGGTRIGASLKQFLDDFGHAGLARGATIVVCSDGLDRGDPDVLATQMARLSRLARQVIWINPLSASPRYEPLARGMRAAMPYVDVFASGHDLANLQELGTLLSTYPAGRART